MSQKTMRIHHRVVNKQKRHLYAQFIDEARKLPFRHRWTLAWSLLFPARKKKA